MRLKEQKHLNMKSLVMILSLTFVFLLSALVAGSYAQTTGNYLAPGFAADILAVLDGETIVGGSIPIGPGGDWGDDAYVLSTPSVISGYAPEVAKVWRVNRFTGEAFVVTTFPSRFDTDPAKKALAFYTSGRIPPNAVISGQLAFDARNVFGPVDSAGNQGLYITSADSGKVFQVAPDGSIKLINNLRQDFNLPLGSDPSGIAFSPPSGWPVGMYVCITNEGPPNNWKLVKYTSPNPVSHSVFVSGTGGCGGFAFDTTSSSAFGGDLYARAGFGISNLQRISPLAAITPFSNVNNLGSDTGIAFAQPGPFEESLYVGLSIVNGITGSIFKILPDGQSILFASNIGGAGMVFDTPHSLLTIRGSNIIRIKPRNAPPIANAGPNQTVEMTSCAGASAILDGSASSDPDNDPLTYTWTENGSVIATGVKPTVTLSYGSHNITLTVDDGKGDTASDDVVINIVDTTAPALNVSLNPNVLWPPNHKYVRVTPSTTVSDACVETTTVMLISRTSNEPDNGLGDGDTANDIVINSDGTLSLRAERSGTGSGRVYTITYQATDAAGNSATASATVAVPHDMSVK